MRAVRPDDLAGATNLSAPLRPGGGLAGAVTRHVLLTLGAIVMLVPFADMLIGALRTPAERLARPPVYWPQDPQWENFSRAFTELPMLAWIGNSLLVTSAITALQLATSALAGFALAKYRFRGRDAILRFVLVAQIFPFFLFIIPMFFLLRSWPLAGGNDLLGQGGTGLLDSYAALILPFAVSWYGVFLMRQFMMSVPDELLDAARLDGAGEFALFTRIALPLVRPGLVTLGLLVWIYHWNEVIWTMTVTRAAPDLQTVTVGIHLLRSEFADERNQSLQQAALAVSVLPVIGLYLALQRHYVRSLFTGALKG
ncbi:MAG TPA: carbohydrate ABC transporter permease [Microvirga sp.]|jgi:multiple sugar transport system permease protein